MEMSEDWSVHACDVRLRNLSHLDGYIAPRMKDTCGRGYKNDSVLNRISELPQELRLEILRRMSLDQLLSLKPSLQLLRLVLPVPHNAEFEPWLAQFLVNQKSGYIFIPSSNRMFISNTNNEFADQDEEVNGDEIEVSDISPSLEPGIYKIRILRRGFDLVQVGYNFISSQCGPLVCHHKEEQKNWASSFISRGFSIQTEDRVDLAPCSWHPRTSWKLFDFRDMSRGRWEEGFFICTKENFWKNEWKQEVLKPYNIDKVSLSPEGPKNEEPSVLELGILKGKGGEVVGYTISGNKFSSYDPQGYPHGTNSEYYEFSLSRYKYAGEITNVGFIVTGAQSMYGMPLVLLEEGQDFPDIKHYL